METRVQLADRLREVLGDALANLKEDRGELTIEVSAQHYLNTVRKLRDELQFAQLVDLCGVDYSQLHRHQGNRFAVVCHLLSFHHNWRLRLRTYCADDADPCVDSLCEIWPNADWYEREAFDLFGITFLGHQDLRRILTDYGFIGHPFRKDFPISGHMEMRYDPELKRIIYQPVTIAPRVVTPRVVREESYGNDK